MHSLSKKRMPGVKTCKRFVNLLVTENEPMKIRSFFLLNTVETHKNKQPLTSES